MGSSEIQAAAAFILTLLRYVFQPIDLMCFGGQVEKEYSELLAAF